MIRMNRHSSIDHPRLLLLLLAVAVLLPSACLLWFMTEAVRNERLAVRQKLTNTYRANLTEAEKAIHEYWDAKKAITEMTADDAMQNTAVFERLVLADLCDSVIILDDQGRSAYPALVRLADVSTDSTWQNAHSMEFHYSNPEGAIDTYKAIANSEVDNAYVQNRAMLGVARCMAKLGRTDEAIDQLVLQLGFNADTSSKWDRACEVNALLFLLTLTQQQNSTRFEAVFERLRHRVTNYEDDSISSSQRIHVMKTMQQIKPDCPHFATLHAEEMALDAIGSEARSSSAQTHNSLYSIGPNEIWGYQVSDIGIVMLFNEARLLDELNRTVSPYMSLDDAKIKCLPVANVHASDTPFIAMDMTGIMDQWTLRLHLLSDDPFSKAADKQVLLYTWTGILGVVVIVVLAVVVGSAMRKQMKLTRLKNDLIATVSHELKTPLASIRLLVDTLAAGTVDKEKEVAEYLRLIGKENRRLTRLIDNFLAFSRMERNKQSFDMERVKADEIVQQAIDAVKTKYEQAECELAVTLAADLPDITADIDAMVTALANLLDNACKYNQSKHKQVKINVSYQSDMMCLEVTDNGIGMSRHAARRVFDRFYQVDQRLSRDVGGCGLGLSIVRFIVEGHNGSVIVESKTDEGSTFTIKIPVSVMN